MRSMLVSLRWVPVVMAAWMSGRVAAAVAPVERPISLADCITLALEHNLDIQIERYSPLIAESRLRLVYGDYDPQVTFRGSHSYSQSPGGVDDRGPFSGRESEADNFSAVLSGLAPGGLSYSISTFAGDRLDRQELRDPVTGDPFMTESPFAQAEFVVGELRQPLLRNFWIDGTRLNVGLRRRDLRISDLNLRLQIINTVSSVEQAYYDLIAARENVVSAEIALRLAMKLYEENKKRVEVGAMAQLDERQAQAQMAASEAAVIEARRAVNFAGNILKNLLTDNYQEWHRVEIVPVEKLDALPQALDVEEAWDLAFRLRPDLLALVIDMERRDLVTRYTRNQLFPQLDVFGAFGWQGADASGRSIGDSYSQVLDGSAPRHSYGAILSFPLSNRRARENFRISKDEKAQAELRLRQARQQIMVGVHDAIQEAESSFQRVGATRAARQFAEEALDAEEKKLANGKSTSFEVLRLQRDLTQARRDETRALADYNKALATVRQRQGSSLLKFDLETAVEIPDRARLP